MKQTKAEAGSKGGASKAQIDPCSPEGAKTEPSAPIRTAEKLAKQHGGKGTRQGRFTALRTARPACPSLCPSRIGKRHQDATSDACGPERSICGRLDIRSPDAQGGCPAQLQELQLKPYLPAFVCYCYTLQRHKPDSGCSLCLCGCACVCRVFCVPASKVWFASWEGVDRAVERAGESRLGGRGELGAPVLEGPDRRGKTKFLPVFIPMRTRQLCAPMVRLWGLFAGILFAIAMSGVCSEKPLDTILQRLRSAATATSNVQAFWQQLGDFVRLTTTNRPGTIKPSPELDTLAVNAFSNLAVVTVTIERLSFITNVLLPPARTPTGHIPENVDAVEDPELRAEFHLLREGNVLYGRIWNAYRTLIITREVYQDWALRITASEYSGSLTNSSRLMQKLETVPSVLPILLDFSNRLTQVKSPGP
jgi:hypothetical protein